MEYIQATSDCSKLEEYNPAFPVDFCSFDLKWKVDRWGLEFNNIQSTTIEGINLIIGGAKVDEYPTEEEFIRNIIKKGLADGIFSINSRIKRYLEE